MSVKTAKKVIDIEAKAVFALKKMTSQKNINLLVFRF